MTSARSSPLRPWTPRGSNSSSDFLRNLQARGRFHFTTDEMAAALDVSPVAARAALRRLVAKGLVASPYRGFHVVVTPQFRDLGCLPADQFVPDLMDRLGEPYYVCLLSAASYHGAAHQVPTVFQVIVPKARRAIGCGGVRVQFVMRRDMKETSVVERNTATGVLRIASPEATAVELVGYPEHCGYLDNVATVLAELHEKLDVNSLAHEAERAPVAWVQRLGYLLSLLEADELAATLDATLAARRVFPVPLAPWLSHGGAPRDARWKVVVNTAVEPDL